MLKDLLYLGVGGALLAKEKVEEQLQKLVKKGRLSEEEVKKIVEEAKKRGEEEEKRAKEELKKLLKEIVAELDLATKKDIEKLCKK
ncbi:MAG: hypothetical protein C6H99_01585 [Epsilonproteobacteria bacterium]|nr:hypothetical protein [Campylobacterota bacterium]NPA63927.1 hypothetical protein [Campylobacterota bacterium]